MLHSSSWLGYSWDLADLVRHGGDGIRKDEVTGRRIEVGRVSRREKFRSRAGPSREEMQWFEILTILRKVSKLPIHLHAGENGISDNYESCRQLQPYVSSSFANSGAHCLGTFVNRGDGLFGVCCEPKLNRMLQEVLWPFDAVGDISSKYSSQISWEDIPSSADPVVGGGYKTGCTGETLKSISRGRKLKNNNEVTDSVAHCDLGDSLGRGERKRWQVEKIASALKAFRLKPGATIVDFGCGSGALTLPLASIFPEFIFVGVDFKRQSIILLEERARKGNLKNVTGVYGRIESYSGSFDACVALHACGIATDLALLQALKNRAAYVMSPCCIGKLQIPIDWTLNSTDSGVSFKETFKPIIGNEIPNFKPLRIASERQHARKAILASASLRSPSTFLRRNAKVLPANFDTEGDNSSVLSLGHSSVSDEVKIEAGSEGEACSGPCVGGSEGSVSSKLTYPRSSWLRSCLSEKEFQVLARAADWSSYEFESFSSRLHLLCKVVLELDRNEASHEVGYWTGLYTLSNEKAGTVGISHVLVGEPQ